MQSLTYGAHACRTRSWTWPFKFSELPGGSVGGGRSCSCVPGGRPSVKVGGAEPVPFPFRKHLPGGSLLDPGQFLLPLNIALVKHQLDRFRMPPPPKPAAPTKPAASVKPTAPAKPASSVKPRAPTYQASSSTKASSTSQASSTKEEQCSQP